MQHTLSSPSPDSPTGTPGRSASSADPAGSGTTPEAANRDGSSLRRRSRLALLLVVSLGALALLSILDISLGSSEVGFTDVLKALTGQESEAANIVIYARLPRLVAGLTVGLALGISGAILQSITRNSLASPDTLGVNAGAYFALTVCAAFGISLPFISSAAIAFLGGVAAAGLVIALSSGPGNSPIRMVLAGSVIALGLGAATSVLLLFFPWQTQGLFAWGAGSLDQAGLDGVLTLLPILVVACVLLAIFGNRLDILQLGEDAASALGVKVRQWQAFFIVMAVVCSAVAVTLTGPIGFVGLCAPATARLLMKFVPSLTKQRMLILVSAIFGALLVVGADTLLRLVFREADAVSVPTGVVTSLIGAVFLVVLAQTARAGFDADSLVTMKAGTKFGLKHAYWLVAIVAVLLAVCAFLAVLLGDTMLLTGDVVNWLKGVSSVRIEIVLDARIPRIVAAILGGACLALAGSILQGVTRNPLADPAVLGISGAGATGAVAVLTILGSSDFWSVLLGALVATLCVGFILFGLSIRGGLDHARMVLAGIGISAGATALTTLMIVRTDPYNQTMAMTWLGGSTYGVTLGQCIPMVLALVVTSVVLAFNARDLDVLQMDEMTPRVLGVNVSRSRIVLITCALVLTAAATVSIGTIAFIGLVAPHAARMMIGRSHARLFVLAALLGSLFVLVADTFGRTIVAPAQIPAGLVTSLLGCPYFIWLLWRMRKS